MCQELNVELSMLMEFEDIVCKDFAGPGTYPTCILQNISRLTVTSTNTFPAITPNTNTSPILSFGSRRASPPKSTPPPPSMPTNPATYSPPAQPHPICPNHPTRLRLLRFFSLAAGMIDDCVKIVSHDLYLGLSIVEQAAHDFAIMKQKMFAFTAPSKW